MTNKWVVGLILGAIIFSSTFYILTVWDSYSSNKDYIVTYLGYGIVPESCSNFNMDTNNSYIKINPTIYLDKKNPRIEIEIYDFFGIVKNETLYVYFDFYNITTDKAYSLESISQIELNVSAYDENNNKYYSKVSTFPHDVLLSNEEECGIYGRAGYLDFSKTVDFNHSESIYYDKYKITAYIIPIDYKNNEIILRANYREKGYEIKWNNNEFAYISSNMNYDPFNTYTGIGKVKIDVSDKIEAPTLELYNIRRNPQKYFEYFSISWTIATLTVALFYGGLEIHNKLKSKNK